MNRSPHCPSRVAPRRGRPSPRRLVATVLFLSAAAGPAEAQVTSVTTLSSRPDMVTGGDALVRIAAPSGAGLAGVRVAVNGTDVTASFRPAPDGLGLLGVATGLRDGDNTLSVDAGGQPLRLTLTNHPITGPLFAGPLESPFMCETERFRLVTGDTLGVPLDANCSVERRVDYVYRSTVDDSLRPWTDRSAHPADVAHTTTSTGAVVPYLIRVETGSAARGVYELALLHDPLAEPEPSPWVSPSGWNGRLIYTLGGGCPGGWYRQGARTGGVTNDFYLRQGYAVASNTLSVFGNNCSELLAAEVAAITKERFVEAYGPPLFTIGTGCSGGAYQTFSIIDNYPGIFDGGIAGCSYPDVQFATTPWNSDARLFLKYFQGKASVPWTEEEQRLAIGFVNHDIIDLIGREPGGHAQRIHVGEACALPEEMRYHPTSNPKGARCEIFEHHVNVYGRNPETGFVRRPIDNVGIQYGLRALNDGAISKEQFLDLNEKVGGYDLDGNVVAARTVGDPIAIRAAYETGRLLSGGGGMADTPVIDFRGYADKQDGGNVHPRFFSFSTKERILEANGHRDAFVMLTVDGDAYGLFSTNDPQVQEAFAQMDRWLTALVRDTSSAAQIDKVRRTRPADLVDACWTPAPERAKIVEEQLDENHGGSRCQALYPSGSFARGVAGSHIRTDIVKCQLKPIDAADYAVTFTASEMARLRAVFPGGVCDWSLPGVAQTRLRGTWLVHGPRPVY